jgi:hypothetical protein
MIGTMLRSVRTVWKRKHKVEPTELAQVLVDSFVRKIVDAGLGKDILHFDAATTVRYETKTRLYQLAVVLT